MNASMLACFLARPRILATSAVDGTTVPAHLARPEEPEFPNQHAARWVRRALHRPDQRSFDHRFQYCAEHGFRWPSRELPLGGRSSRSIDPLLREPGAVRGRGPGIAQDLRRQRKVPDPDVDGDT